MFRSGAPEKWHVRRKQLRTGAPEQWRDSALHAKSSMSIRDSSSTASTSVQGSSRALLSPSTSDQLMLLQSSSANGMSHSNESGAASTAALNQHLPAEPEHAVHPLSGPLNELALALPLREGGNVHTQSISEYHVLQNQAGAQPVIPDAPGSVTGTGPWQSQQAQSYSARFPSQSAEAGQGAAEDQLHPLASELDFESMRRLTRHRHSLGRHRHGSLQKHRQTSLDWNHTNSMKQQSQNLPAESKQTGMKQLQYDSPDGEGRISMDRYRHDIASKDPKALSMPFIGSGGAGNSAPALRIGEGQNGDNAGLPQDVPTAVAGHVKDWFSRLQSGKREPAEMDGGSPV